MSGKPTRDEMIRMAMEMGKQVTSAAVGREELDAFPARIKNLAVPTRVGDSQVYLLSPEGTEGRRPLVINFYGAGF